MPNLWEITMKEEQLRCRVIFPNEKREYSAIDMINSTNQCGNPVHNQEGCHPSFYDTHRCINHLDKKQFYIHRDESLESLISSGINVYKKLGLL